MSWEVVAINIATWSTKKTQAPRWIMSCGITWMGFITLLTMNIRQEKNSMMQCQKNSAYQKPNGIHNTLLYIKGINGCQITRSKQRVLLFIILTGCWTEIAPHKRYTLFASSSTPRFHVVSFKSFTFDEAGRFFQLYRFGRRDTWKTFDWERLKSCNTFNLWRQC